MKTTKKGRRYSRKVTLEPESFSELDRLFRDHGSEDEHGRIHIGSDYSSLVRESADFAATLLRERGLPDFPWLHFPTEDIGHWRPGKGTGARGCCTVEYYVIEIRGHQHDSMAGLAASILTTCDRALNCTGDIALLQAYKLGDLMRLAKVYGIAGSWQRRGGESKPSHRGKAGEMQEAVDALHKERPRLSYEDIKRRVAEQFDCSTTTVKRYTQNPKRK